MNVLFLEILYRPLFNLLVLFYGYIPGHDVGLAIIALTLLVRFAVFPLSLKSIKEQRKLQVLQPKIKELSTRFKNDKERHSREMMKFYKENKVNPLSSCFPLIVQLLVFIALYNVFRDGITKPTELGLLYHWVPSPGEINPIAFGFLSLANANWILALIASGLQFWQSWMLLRKQKKDREKKAVPPASKGTAEDMASAMSNQMIYTMPIITFFITFKLPAGLPFYWIVTTLFSIVQQWIVIRHEKRNATSLPERT